jgi:hypothetical protein
VGAVESRDYLRSALLDYEQIQADFQNTASGFLQADLDLALTFLDMESDRQDAERARRLRGHALTAYYTVLRLRPFVRNPEAKAALEAKLAIVRNRLSTPTGADTPGMGD